MIIVGVLDVKIHKIGQVIGLLEKKVRYRRLDRCC